MKRYLAIVLVMWTGTAFTQEQPAPRAPVAPATYQVSGVVVNAVTGETLAGVRLTLGPNGVARQRAMLRQGPRNEASNVRETRSAADGTFAFDHVGTGKYSLAAARHGFTQQEFDQHEQFSSAIVVGSEKVSTGLRFALEPDASISGTIVDDHNDPVMNASVLLFRAGVQQGRRGIFRVQQTMSNDIGRYRLSHLRPGKYYVAVSATPWYAENGRFGGLRAMPAGAIVGGGGGMAPNNYNPALDVAYPLTFYPGVTDSNQAEAVRLDAGQQEDADFTLAPVPSLHLRIHAPSSDQQPNIFATLTSEVFGTPEFLRGARSINYGQGYTEISGITPGHYVLQLHEAGSDRENRTPVEREIDVTGDMDFTAGDPAAGVNLTGTVRFEGPAPTGDVRLMLRHPGMQGTPIQVNAMGEMTSPDPLPSGKYEIFLPMPNYQITHIGVTGGKLDGQSIQVGSDDVHLTLDVAKASAKVEGTVLKNGKGFAGAMVVLIPQDMSRPMLYRRDQSDSDGSFTLSGIPPGTYTAVAFENGWDLEWSNPDVIRPFLAAGDKVQVAIDGDYHVDTKIQTVPAAH